jgi:two-component system response regulator
MIAMTKTDYKPHKTEPQDVKKTPKQGHDADRAPWADLSNLHHELCTLLNTIIGYSEMLLEDAEDAGKKVYISNLGKIHAAGKQLFKLVDEILQSAKIDAARENLDLEAFGAMLRHKLRTPLNTIISSSEMLLEDAEKQGQENFIPDLQKIDAAGQHIQRLINKIVKHSKIQPGEMDTDIQTLASSSVTSSLIQDVVSTTCPPAEDAASTKPNEQGFLLIVDDNETNRDLLAHHLESQGHTVAQAQNGRQALEMIDKDRFDLVLLDLIMPEMNGYQVLTHMKNGIGCKNIPVIMISALGEMDSVAQCIEMGAEDYLPKPFNPVLLKARINACLEKKRLRDMERLYAKSMELELEIGQQIQRGFFPNALPQLPGWEIAAFFQAARQVAGDFYDAFLLCNGKQAGLVIADVCDKGVGSALFMVLFRSLIRVFSGQTHLCDHLCKSFISANKKTAGDMIIQQETIDIEQSNALVAVALANDYIEKNHSDMGMFVTLFFGILNPETGLLSYINAGHEPLFIVGPTGVKVSLQPTGPAVGMMPDAKFKIEHVQLEPGDILIGYTDGVTEARSLNGYFYTKKRLQSLLKQPVASAPELIESIKTSLFNYTENAPQSDDITLLAVQRYPKGQYGRDTNS